MNRGGFHGRLVRLAIFDPEHDAKNWARWNQDSEFQQLFSSGPLSLWSEKQIQEWAEKHSAEMFSFTIRTLTDDRAIGSIERH